MLEIDKRINQNNGQEISVKTNEGEFIISKELSVNVDDEVWLLSCSDNKRQLHWIRKDNFEEEDKDLINGKNVDILMNRSSGISRAILMFDDENGWLIQNGPGSIRMSNDGSIHITSGDTNRGISITPSGISFGTSGASNHTACFGDET